MIPAPWRGQRLLAIGGYGLACWFVPFAAAMAMYPLRVTHQMLFESLIAVVLAATVVGVATAYLARISAVSGKHATLVGLAWVLQSLLLDWLAFSIGPMRMALTDYVADIGVSYLMIPIVTLGLAWQRRSASNPGE